MTPLSGKQQAVADLLPEGLQSKEIARRLGIAEATVKVHLKAINKALGTTNRVQIAILIDRQSRAGIRANWAFGEKRQQS